MQAYIGTYADCQLLHQDQQQGRKYANLFFLARFYTAAELLFAQGVRHLLMLHLLSIYRIVLLPAPVTCLVNSRVWCVRSAQHLWLLHVAAVCSLQVLVELAIGCHSCCAAMQGRRDRRDTSTCMKAGGYTLATRKTLYITKSNAPPSQLTHYLSR